MFKNNAVRAAAALGAIVLSASAAQAQPTFIGSTLGCFYTTTVCTPTATATLMGLTFTGSTFNQDGVIDPSGTTGTASFNTSTNNFGGFALNGTPHTYAGYNFLLQINTTSPATGSLAWAGAVKGSVDKKGNSSVAIDFANNAFTPLNPGSSGILAQNNDLAIRIGPDNFANGQLQAGIVPEPSTYALMGAGLAGLLVAARRRRSV